MTNWSEEYYNSLLSSLDEVMREQQRDIIAVICARLKAVGNLNPTSAKQMANLAKYQNADLKEMKRIVKRTTGIVEKEIDNIFQEAAQDSKEYADVLAQQAAGMSFAVNVQKLAEAAARRYKDNFLNLADTYAFKTDGQTLSIRQQYVKCVNRAVTAVSTGTLDYNTAIRQTVKEMTDSGLRIIEWESGYRRRADSSIRMNVLEGARQINQEILKEAGKKFATGFEISAHDRPAPDHADIQGKQYTTEEYEALNASLARPIGTLGCMHIAYPIVYGVTSPTYTDKELADMKRNAEKKYTWEGKEYTGYECTQRQRKYETDIRRAKDLVNALKAAGDDIGARHEQKRVHALNKEYRAFSEHVGLSVKNNRLGVAKAKQSEIVTAQRNINISKNRDKTLANQNRMAYNTPPVYDALRAQYEKDVQEGWISPLSGYMNYKKLYNRIQTEIVGKTINGVVINGQKPHFMQRVIGTMVDPKILKEELRVARRSGVALDDIEDALFNPMDIRTTIRPLGERSMKLIGSRCVVTINPDTGMLIQTNLV